MSGSEGAEMEGREAGSGGGEDPSSLQLTTADGECVLLYTVNTTHCTHYYGLAVVSPYVRMGQKQDGGSNLCISVYIPIISPCSKC